MKKKLLEKDGFYLALFACICLVAVGGVWFTKNNVDELASSNGFVNNNEESKNKDELHLIEKENNDAVPTTTESEENLEKAKEKEAQKNKEESKLSFLGKEIVREYSVKEPSYSKTLNLWEIHKGLDVSSTKGQEVKALLAGKIVDVFKDDEHGMSVKVKSDNDVTVVYSNLNEKISVKKDQAIKEGQSLGNVGETSTVESEDGPHVHIEAFKGKESIDPMSLIK
ncbi:MAG: peptidoglycan DD-metalloendopeptidase family protein [Romboutsia sp.]|uniref:peptidoglycan DD-metalloendopeptidase family protein n=1 Tax=Romboutsia sp. TaxID=1965302 RepID=UPI003F3B60E9